MPEHWKWFWAVGIKKVLRWIGAFLLGVVLALPIIVGFIALCNWLDIRPDTMLCILYFVGVGLLGINLVVKCAWEESTTKKEVD